VTVSSTAAACFRLFGGRDSQSNVVGRRLTLVLADVTLSTRLAEHSPVSRRYCKQVLPANTSPEWRVDIFGGLASPRAAQVARQRGPPAGPWVTR